MNNVYSKMKLTVMLSLSLLTACMPITPTKAVQTMVIADDGQVSFDYQGTFEDNLELFKLYFLAVSDPNSPDGDIETIMAIQRDSQDFQKDVQYAIMRFGNIVKNQRNGALYDIHWSNEYQLSNEFEGIPTIYEEGQRIYVLPIAVLKINDQQQYFFDEILRQKVSKLEQICSGCKIKSQEAFNQYLTALNKNIKAMDVTLNIEVNPKHVLTASGYQLESASLNKLPDGEAGRKIFTYQLSNEAKSAPMDFRFKIDGLAKAQ